MDRVEQFETNNVNHCTIFSVLRNVKLDFIIYTMFWKVKMWSFEVVHEIKQNCQKLICGESWEVLSQQSEPLYYI